MTGWQRVATVIGGLQSASSIARSSAALGAGTLVGQLSLVLAAPLLARLYDPNAFGALATYSALLMILAAGATLRYDFAIPIARGSAEAALLFVLSLGIGFVSSAAVLAMVFVAGGALASLLGAANGQAQALWILPVGLFIAATGQSLGGFAVHHRAFSALARTRVYQGVALACCQLGLGVLQAGAIGLVVGDVSGRAIAAGALYRALRIRTAHTRISLARLRFAARRYWGFARVMTLASVAGALSLQVPFLLLPLLFDLDATGQYFMAYRMLVLPASLLAAAVSQVFFGEAAHRRERPEAMRHLAKRSAAVLFMFSVPTYAVAFVAGPQLFVAVLGDEWQEAGEMARIMSPWLLVWSVASPLSTLLLVGRRERESLFFTSAEFLARSFAIGIGAALGSLFGAIVALSVVSLAISTAGLWRILRVASLRLRDLARPVATTVAMTLPAIVALALVVSLLPPDASSLIIVAAGAVAWLAGVASGSWRSAELRALLRETDD